MPHCATCLYFRPRRPADRTIENRPDLTCFCTRLELPTSHFLYRCDGDFYVFDFSFIDDLKQFIHDATAVRNSPKLYQGICAQLPGYACTFFRFYCLQWPKRSISLNYPIPVTDLPDLSRPFDQYAHCAQYNSYWTGRQGELRRELLTFCIAQATDDLTKLSA